MLIQAGHTNSQIIPLIYSKLTIQLLRVKIDGHVDFGFQFLEDDINGHQEMFASLNENGQQIMAEMEPGDVLTAVQAKLDDMNDRCQSRISH